MKTSIINFITGNGTPRQINQVAFVGVIIVNIVLGIAMYLS